MPLGLKLGTSGTQCTTAREQSGWRHTALMILIPLPCNRMHPLRLWLTVSPFLQVQMVVISMLPFFSLMTLTILLELLQLLLTASIRELDRARGSFLWQHAVTPTLRFLTFPRAPFWT